MPRGVVPKAGTDELRGIADQGAPRKRLRTRGGEPVESLNEKCRAGDWTHEDKDSLEQAALNGAIVQALGDLADEFVFEIALDMSKWFHRCFFHALSLWESGALVPDTATGSLKWALEMELGA